MRSAASVTIVGVNEFPLAIAISDSSVSAAAGNRLGFGLQPMLNIASLWTALIHVNEVCLPGQLVSRRLGIYLRLVRVRTLSRRSCAG
jgi:hypothetical protein